MKKFLIWASVILILILGLFVYWKYFYTYSEGYRSGLLQKFSYKGNLFKTYEGELILSSVETNKSVYLASEKFFFSVKSKTLADRLDTLQGYQVSLHYLEKHGRLFWLGDTRYFVDSVRVIHHP